MVCDSMITVREGWMSDKRHGLWGLECLECFREFKIKMKMRWSAMKRRRLIRSTGMIVMILWDNLSDLFPRRTTSWRPEMANNSGYFFRVLRVLRRENPSEEFRGDASVAVTGGWCAPKPKADDDLGQHLELYFNENLFVFFLINNNDNNNTGEL